MTSIAPLSPVAPTPPVLAGFALLGVLGQGATGTVYAAARLPNLEKSAKFWPPITPTHAIKVTHGAHRQVFEHETRVLSGLRHPGIVRLHQSGWFDGNGVAVMDWHPLGALHGWWPGQIDEACRVTMALRLLHHVAQALAVVHAHGWVHSDLTPRNILINAQQRPVLADFGLAVRCGEPPRVWTAPAQGVCTAGSLRHMSPEQARGETLGPHSDFYALGVLLHLLLTGRAPFVGPDRQAVLRQHCQAPIPVLPQPLLCAQPLLDGLLAKQPSNRLHSAQAVLDAIDACLKKIGWV